MAERSLELEGADCPAGLLRCRAGHLERSLAAHVPVRCERGEGCGCPALAVGECPDAAGCLLEDAWVELEDGMDAALCRTPAERAVPVQAPVAPGICDSDDARCVAGELVRCHPSPRVVGRCLRGCAGPGTVDVAVDDRALAALCRP